MYKRLSFITDAIEIGARRLGGFSQFEDHGEQWDEKSFTAEYLLGEECDRYLEETWMVMDYLGTKSNGDNTYRFAPEEDEKARLFDLWCEIGVISCQTLISEHIKDN